MLDVRIYLTPNERNVEDLCLLDICNVYSILFEATRRDATRRDATEFPVDVYAAVVVRGEGRLLFLCC